MSSASLICPSRESIDPGILAHLLVHPDAVPRLAQDAIVDGPAPAADCLPRIWLAERRRAVQRLVELAARLECRMDPLHLAQALDIVKALPLKQDGIACNADMRPADVRQFCELDETSRALMRSAMNQLQLSARAYHRILKLARTIADLASSERIQPAHLAEALQYRPRMMEG